MTTHGAVTTAEGLLQHSAWLRALARHLVDERAAADDLIQETWISVLRAGPDTSRPIRPWLGTVVRNAARMRWRQESRRVAREHRLASEETPPLPTPEELVHRQEVQRAIAEAVLGLAEPLRSTVLLCYAEGLTPIEVARRDGIPPGTVRARLKRALDELRARFATREDGPTWNRALAQLAATPAAGRLLQARRAIRWPLLAGTVTVLLIGAGGLLGRSADTRARRAPVATAVTSARAPGRARSVGGERRPQSSLAESSGPESAAALLARAAEPGGAPTRGSADAPVTLVAFIDYTSPFCAPLGSTLGQLGKAFPDDLLIAVKQLPITEDAALPAEAALAAHAQGKFWSMHDRLLANQSAFDRATLETHARTIGLDMDRFQAALTERTYQAAVEAQREEARLADIAGAPTFLVNGHKLLGAKSLEALTYAVRTELAKLSGLSLPPAPPSTRSDEPRVRLSRYRWPVPQVALPDATIKSAPTLPSVADPPFVGDPAAPIEIVHLAHYGGQSSDRWSNILEALARDRAADVRIVFRPVAHSRNAVAVLAGEAAWGAHAQGKFLGMHERLMAASRLDRATVEAIGTELGLDMPAFRVALDQHLHVDKVRLPPTFPRSLHLPVVLVAGRVAESPVSFAQLLDRELARSGRPTVARVQQPPELAATSDSYSPYKMTQYLTWPEIFALEPRDPAWASAIEKDIGGVVLADIKSATRGNERVSFECRTTLCSVTWIGGESADDATRKVLSTTDQDIGALVLATAGQYLYAFRLPGRATEPVAHAVTRFAESRTRRLADVGRRIGE